MKTTGSLQNSPATLDGLYFLTLLVHTVKEKKVYYCVIIVIKQAENDDILNFKRNM